VHVIYHIPGQKVGCSKQFDIRKKQYPKGTVFQVLEELTDCTDEEAGDVEWAWADHFGYRRGQHYSIAVKASIASANMSEDSRRILATQASVQRQMHRAEYSARQKDLMTRRTQEERSEIAKRGVQSQTPEQRSAKALKAAATKRLKALQKMEFV
jgi:arginyl-tRNA--protein-N-Asp/Glu arginylyltransferase